MPLGLTKKKIKVKSFTDNFFFPLHFGIVICQMKHPTVSYLTDRFHNLLTFVVHLFKIKTIVWRDRGVFTVYIYIYMLEQLYISFSYVCSGTFVSFMAGLALLG